METYIAERYELAAQRVSEIEKESCVQDRALDYFQRTASFIKKMTETYEYIKDGGLQRASVEELQILNKRLYQDVLPEHYKESYTNPAYAVEMLGEKYGQLLSFLYTELRSLIVYAFEQNREEMVIRMELFLEIYNVFVCVFEEKHDSTLPVYQELRDIVYWFVSDYSEPAARKKLREQLCPKEDFALRIIMDNDLQDPRYLYYFGEYITDNEIETAKRLNGMTQEEIKRLADTYTEGYRIGFEVCNKDISKKKTVNIRYSLGFERMIKEAVANFDRLGLKTVIYRAGVSVLEGKGIRKNGYCATAANRQYEYDHKDDWALYLDPQFVNRRLEVMKEAFEELKVEASLFGGPAVLETFGEMPFAPETKKEVLQLSDKQQKLAVEYAARLGALQNEYIKGEERSFTIIAFPMPAIGDKYPEIFQEIVRVNTLDYKLYQRIQQIIIDALDEAEHVTVKGMGGNRTDLKVMLHELKEPDKETNFENCVADVNIPVGEVFTSPVLKGTDGILHVRRVFLNELEYKNLAITFHDGMIEDYTCTNFGTEEENKRYIKENVMFHHDTLPLGEFAIGTNTKAYMAAKKYDIGDKLPILIAEKMGPHFAVGDTCYSHEEDMLTYNPDGKAIIARENEVSALRRSDNRAAYFNCHTDITIPYDELGELAAVAKDGKKTVIIQEGRFVLCGCEELNRPFDDKI